jgi:UDP-N-acetylmuramyl pentapeptide synthase
MVESYIPVPGEFMALNGCGAVAVGHAAGIPASKMASALKNYHSVGDRMKVSIVGSTRFINDSYNANTLSMKAALNSLQQISAPQKIVLLGDMLEMGEEEESAHIEILKLAISMGFQIGIVGPRFQNAAQKIKKIAHDRINWITQNAQEMAGIVKALPRNKRTILLKGSRGIKMEHILHEYDREEE